MAHETTAAPTAGAIAELCDHAGEVWSFFGRVLGQRPLCRDEWRRREIRESLRRLVSPGGWGSETALEHCACSAVAGAEQRGESGAGDLELAASLWNTTVDERARLLERVDALYAPAVRADRTREARVAVAKLVDVLRGLRKVLEWDDWSEHRDSLVDAIREARPWAQDDGEKTEKPVVKRAARKRINGEQRLYTDEVYRDLVEWVNDRDPKGKIHDSIVEFCDARGINASKQLNRSEGDDVRTILAVWWETADKAMRRNGRDSRRDKAGTTRRRRHAKAKSGSRRRS